RPTTPTPPPAPNAGVSVSRVPGAPNGDPMIAATLTARTGCGAISVIQFGDPGQPFANARVTITSPANGPGGETLGFVYAPPPGTTAITLVIERVVQAGGATVSPIRFTDACGEWRTFVGGGPDVFR